MRTIKTILELLKTVLKVGPEGNRLKVDAQLGVGDIQIGAVEIKDATTNTRGVVKNDGVDNAVVVVQNISPMPSEIARKVTYTYDANNNMITKVETSIAGTFITTYTYDVNNNMLTETTVRG